MGRTARRAALVAACLLAALLATAPAAAQSLSVNLGSACGSAAGGQSLTTSVISIVAVTTVLSLAPGILVVATSFTRLVVVLSLLRTAMGLQQSPPNTVIVSLALFLSAFIMAPAFETAYRDGIHPLMDGSITEEQAFDRTVQPFRAFMEANVRSQDLTLFTDLAHWTPPPSTAQPAPVAGKKPIVHGVPLQILCPAFLVGELSKAFQIGFLLFLPFLVIDIAVSSVLMGMGMMMLPPTVVSLPFKLIFFVLVDGWELVAGSLVRSFAT